MMQITLTLELETYRRLKEKADQRSISISELISQLIGNFLSS